MKERKARPVENLDVYGVYQLAPLIREAVLADAEGYREGRSETRLESQRILQKVWSTGTNRFTRRIRYIGATRFYA